MLTNLKIHIITATTILLSTALKAEVVKEVFVKNARADLSSYSFDQTIINFGGEAHFYPDTFITSTPKQIKPRLLDIAKSWNNQIDNDLNLPVFGYGTYHMQIKIPSKLVGETFIIRPNHFIAYASEIYVNKQMVSRNGFVGTAKLDSSYRPNRNTIVNPFVADSSILDVFICVSNFNHFRGGIFNKVKFGLAENMIKHREWTVMYDLFIIISLLIMFLYHFVLYFVNSREHIALFFSITCLVFSIDFSFQDSVSFFLFFPNAGFKFTSLLQISMPYFFPSCFLFFLHALFPNEVAKPIRNLSGIITIILIALTSLGNTHLTSLIVKPHYIYLIFVITYIYIIAIKAVRNKREGAYLFMAAYLIFSLCAINDILFVLEIIYTASLVSTGLILFVFLLSVLQGRRMIIMYNKNVKLSEALQELNVTLEHKVEERTTKLNETILKIKSLTQFKEDMTNMVVHDLKAPLSTIINVKHINNENGLNLVQQAGYKMLNLIQNILGVYRSENAGIGLSLKEERIASIISSAFDEVKLLAEQKSVEIVYIKEARCFVKTDEDILRRVFVNLLLNAIKFSPQGGVIKIKIQVNNNKLARISIINQGTPIPSNQQSLIFERFGQSEKRQTGIIGSTGLGLTFCKMAIEAHGGQIGVNSTPDSDVEFWFSLPNAYCINCENCMSDGSGLECIPLTSADVEYLAPYKKKLNEHKVFEVTAINRILKSIDNGNPNINRWIRAVEEIVYSGDVEGFRNL